ncbi:MAG: hypothetical protein ACE5LA_01850 [Dehalococcoidales bacterium]
MRDTKNEINECLELHRKIREEYPQELNLDKLHEVTGEYAKIKEYRDKINEHPKEVRTLCEFILATKCSDEERVKFFSYISSHPKAFTTVKKETFIEKRQRIADVAKEMGIEASMSFHLVSVAKLKGLLGKQDELVDEHRSLIKQYLE